MLRAWLQSPCPVLRAWSVSGHSHGLRDLLSVAREADSMAGQRSGPSGRALEAHVEPDEKQVCAVLCPAPRAGHGELRADGPREDELKRTNLAFICLKDSTDVLAFHREKRLLLADINLSHFFLRPDIACPG